MPKTTANTDQRAPSKMTVHDALAFIQARLVAPKDARNSFGGYNYRSAEQILSAVKPLLAETGAVLTIDDEIYEVAGRIYVRACARLSMPPANGIGSAEEIRTYAYAREPEARKGMDDAQCTGSSSSYARKYALCGLFAVDDSRLDPDATYRHEGRDVPAVPVPAKGNPPVPAKGNPPVPAKGNPPVPAPVKAKPINPDAPSAKDVVAKLCACESLDELRKATIELVHEGADKEKTFALGAQVAKEKGFNGAKKQETKETK